MIGRQFDSMYEMEEFLFNSAQDINFTIVRPPRLIDTPLSSKRYNNTSVRPNRRLAKIHGPSELKKRSGSTEKIIFKSLSLVNLRLEHDRVPTLGNTTLIFFYLLKKIQKK